MPSESEFSDSSDKHLLSVSISGEMVIAGKHTDSFRMFGIRLLLIDVLSLDWFDSILAERLKGGDFRYSPTDKNEDGSGISTSTILTLESILGLAGSTKDGRLVARHMSVAKWWVGEGGGESYGTSTPGRLIESCRLGRYPMPTVAMVSGVWSNLIETGSNTIDLIIPLEIEDVLLMLSLCDGS